MIQSEPDRMPAGADTDCSQKASQAALVWSAQNVQRRSMVSVLPFSLVQAADRKPSRCPTDRSRLMGRGTRILIQLAAGFRRPGGHWTRSQSVPGTDVYSGPRLRLSLAGGRTSAWEINHDFQASLANYRRISRLQTINCRREPLCACSFSVNFRTLPDAVSGNESTTYQSDGAFCGASKSRQ